MLRENLQTIRDRSDDPHLKRLIDDVLQGRRTMRELVRDEKFTEELNAGMRRFGEHWEQLTPEQRAALVRQGQAEESERRRAAGLPPLAEPPASPGDSPLLREDP
jgi:hypothetical protein